MRLAAVMLTAGLVAGCAIGGQAHVGSMIGSGELQLAPIEGDPTRLTVTIRSSGFAPAYERADMQQRIVDTALAQQCGKPHIESRRQTEFGTTPIGVPIRLYTLTVRCPNGASTPAER